MSSHATRGGQKKVPGHQKSVSSNGHSAMNGSQEKKLEIVGSLIGRLFKADVDNRTWGQAVPDDVEMVILQRKNEAHLTFVLKIISKGKEILTQQLNLSLRVRLKDELVQWQLKRSPDTEPVTFGLRCSTFENAQKLENLLKDIKYNLEVDQKTSTPRKPTEEIFVKAHLPDNQSTKVAVAGGMTVNSLFILIAARRRLDPTTHEIRINQGKYLAAVRPTLAVQSLGVKEVYIVQVHNTNRSQGRSRIITIRLPTKKDTYIQVKDQRKVRDLYSYICEKKDLTPSLYRLKYNAKIEGEKDMDKTIGQLDLWSVELETIQKVKPPTVKPTAQLGKEETDSGAPSPAKVERKPKRAAPPPPGKKKESITPATSSDPPRGVPLVGMAGKKTKPETTPPVQHTTPPNGSVAQESNYSSDEDDDNFVVVAPTMSSTPKPPPPLPQATKPPSTPPRPIATSQSFTATDSSPGKPKRRAPPLPPSVKKSSSICEGSPKPVVTSSQSEPRIASVEQISNVEETGVEGQRRTSVEKTATIEQMSLEEQTTASVEQEVVSVTASTVTPIPDPLPRKLVRGEIKSDPVESPESSVSSVNKFDTDFDDINSFFNDIIAEADSYFKEQPEDELLTQPTVHSRANSIQPVPKPRNSPPTSAKPRERTPRESPMATPRRTPPNSSPNLSSDRDGFVSNNSSEASPPSRKNSNIVKDPTGKQMLIVYPSPGTRRKDKKGSLAFEIPPPPPLVSEEPMNEQLPEQEPVTEEDTTVTEVSGDDNKDESLQLDKADSDNSDSESGQEAHYILGLTPSASFDVPQGEDEDIDTLRHTMVDISKSDLVTTSFSEETDNMENNDKREQDGYESKEEGNTVGEEEINEEMHSSVTEVKEPIPSPLPTPGVSSSNVAGFFLPPPDEFEAPKPPSPTCSPPDSTDDEVSPYSPVTEQPPQKVPMRKKTAEETAQSNRPMSVHGSLINVISNLQGLLAGDGDNDGNDTSKATDFSQPLTETQGESSEDEDVDSPFTRVEQPASETESQQPVPQAPPLPPVVRPTHSVHKVSNPPPPPAHISPKKNPPPVLKKPIKTPAKQPPSVSSADVEQELRAKLKKRQEKIRDIDVTENKTTPVVPSSTQPILPQQTVPASLPGMQPSMGQTGQMGIPMDPQQMLLQQQALQQQVMQLQQQLQLFQQMQGPGSTNTVQGVPMMNSSLQMQQMMMMMMAQGNPPVNPMSQGTPQVNPMLQGNSQGNSMMSQGNSMTNLMLSSMGMAPAMPQMQPTQLLSQTAQLPSQSSVKLSASRESLTNSSDVATVRSERLGDMEEDFDKVMEEVRDTNPMTILKKVNGPGRMESRKSTQMEEALISAMNNRRSHLDISQHSQHEEDFDSSW